MPQQADAVRPGVGGVAVRKVQTDVPQCGRAQQRVHHRVGQHIRVGVAQQPFFIGNRDAAQHQAAARHQAVHIVSVSNAELYAHFALLLFKIASASGRSAGVVILMFSSLPWLR